VNAAERAAALTVRCGLPGCDQPPGEPCVSTADSKFQRDNPHYNRWARGLQATSQQLAELASARQELDQARGRAHTSVVTLSQEVVRLQGQLAAARAEIAQLRVEYGLDREKSRRSGCPNPITDEGAPTMTTTNPGGEGGSVPKNIARAADNFEEIQAVPAGKRLALDWTPWMGDWFVSSSPRNGNSNAEGQWDQWVDLAIGILKDQLTALVRPEAHAAAQALATFGFYSEANRCLTDGELNQRFGHADDTDG
jgi:hypothetical protein